jgi:hypothetical protein
MNREFVDTAGWIAKGGLEDDPFPLTPPSPLGRGSTIDRVGFEEPFGVYDRGRVEAKRGRRCALPPHSIGRSRCRFPEKQLDSMAMLGRRGCVTFANLGADAKDAGSDAVGT